MLLLLRTCVLTGALLSSACASSQFDRHFEARRWSAAADAFAADSSLHFREPTLFRAALLHATPRSETYDPARARELLERLMDLHPGTSRRETVQGMIALLDEVERVRIESALREQEVRRELAILNGEVVRLRDDIASLESRFQAREEENDLLRRITARLEADLREREYRLRLLTEELDRLKEIDLRSPARPSGRNQGTSNDSNR